MLPPPPDQSPKNYLAHYIGALNNLQNEYGKPELAMNADMNMLKPPTGEKAFMAKVKNISRDMSTEEWPHDLCSGKETSCQGSPGLG